MDTRQRARGLDRRRFLLLGAASVGVAATAGRFRLGGTATPLPEAAAQDRNPLYVPPIVGPSGLTLTARESQIHFGGGFTTAAMAYNASVPGPTVVAARGATADITLSNRLGEDTTIHWHGLHVAPDVDGQPHDAVGPGGTFRYQFPINQRAGFNWYHPHPHMRTAPQVAFGLAGGFLVTDPEEAAFGLPSGAHEVPLVFRDVDFNKRGDLLYKPSSSGYLGKVPLVNGTRDATLAVDPAVYRLRMLNGHNARVLRLAFDDGTPLVLIGNDGGLLEAPVPLDEITLGPAERLDVLVDFRGRGVGQRTMLRCLDARWDLLEFVVSSQVAGGSIPQGTLSTIPPLGPPVRTREFGFDGMSRINGQTYDMHRVDFQVPFGETERWRFTTGGNAPHPVHVHGTHFQVVTRGGNRRRADILPWERGWKDTVLLEKGETVEVLIRFDVHRGRYLLHCHQLEHEDAGMMANFEVV